MATVGTVTCPQKGCGEDRVSLIHEINDPMGKRYYCCVCGHEFKQGSELSIQKQTTIGLRDSLTR